MANDRMYIRCKVCGRHMILAKHFGCGWISKDVNINKFIDAHEDSCTCFCENSHCYEIRYETEPENWECEKPVAAEYWPVKEDLQCQMSRCVTSAESFIQTNRM